MKAHESLILKLAKRGIEGASAETTIDKIVAAIPIRSMYPDDKYEAANAFFDTYVSCYDLGLSANIMTSPPIHEEVPLPADFEEIDLRSMSLKEAIAAITRRATDLSKFTPNHYGKTIGTLQDIYERARLISLRTFKDREELHMMYPNDTKPAQLICEYIGRDEEAWEQVNATFDALGIPKDENVRDGLCSIIARTSDTYIDYGTPLETVAVLEVLKWFQTVKRIFSY